MQAAATRKRGRTDATTAAVQPAQDPAIRSSKRLCTKHTPTVSNAVQERASTGRKARRGAASTSRSQVRTATPDLADLPCAANRNRFRIRLAARAAAAAAPPAPGAAQQAQDAAGAAATPVQIALQTAAALSQTPPAQISTRPQLSHAEPFSLGVQWAAYYSNPSTNMPGYPQGYWHSEPSPFAALASQTLLDQDSAGSGTAGPSTGSSAGVNNAAGLQ